MSTAGQIKTISIAGAGNLAWHLGPALFEKGIHIRQVYSPTQAHAEELAKHVSASPASNISQLDTNVDLIILCIKDDAVKEIAAQFAASSVPVVHTSGSISIDVFRGHNGPAGVFYPLQSFRRERPVNWNEIPVCIESTDPRFLAALKELGALLSGRVQVLTSEQRAWLHLAAVMVSNFSNLLYIEAENILGDKDLNFSLLRPLISETAARLVTASPATLQTGPAKRNDVTVIDRHMKMLEEYPELREMYVLLTGMVKRLKD